MIQLNCNAMSDGEYVVFVTSYSTHLAQNVLLKSFFGVLN